MTAEIAICNENGIALAADSAVSMMGGDKIYNSANKLFSLSKYHPVAIMVYNNASLLSVPWETVIKQYRRSLGDKSFSTLKEYSQSFWGFIEGKHEWFPEKDVRRHVASKMVDQLMGLKERLEEGWAECDRDGADLEAVLMALVERVVKGFASDVEGLGFADGFAEDDLDVLRETYLDVVRDRAAACLEVIWEKMGDDVRRDLERALLLSLTKDSFTHYSGVVIAGYGDSEIYPRIAAYSVGIMVAGKLRMRYEANLSNIDSQEFTPAIYPFAQDDVVRSFINGVDPAINSFVRYTLCEGVLESVDRLLCAELGDSGEATKARLAVGQALQGVQADIVQGYMEHCYTVSTKPLLDMLRFLPKDELAEMAESLINLTAFKRRMSSAKESVGGPVDVAILSKGDGLIWIRRKHYFDPALNQHFFSNYYR